MRERRSDKRKELQYQEVEEDGVEDKEIFYNEETGRNFSDIFKFAVYFAIGPLKPRISSRKISKSERILRRRKGCERLQYEIDSFPTIL